MAYSVREILQTAIGITDEELLQQIESAAEIRKVKKGMHWEAADKQRPDVGVLLSGLFRYYYIGPKGKEQTDCIAWLPGHMVLPLMPEAFPSPMAASALPITANVNIVALEDSEVLTLSFDLVQHLVETLPSAKDAMGRLMQASLAEHYTVQKALLHYDAEQRYQWFLNRYPGLIDRVPLMYVASFLGITPVSLSRLRRKT